MKLSAAFSILVDLRFGIQAAFMPTLYAVLDSPSLLLRPSDFSRIFMANLWATFGNGVDENGRGVKQQLITLNAYGVVLDIGAGQSVFIIISCNNGAHNNLYKAMDTRQIISTRAA